jgi:hypothetical protein
MHSEDLSPEATRLMRVGCGATAEIGQSDPIYTLEHSNPSRFDRAVGLGPKETTTVLREPEVLRHVFPLLRGGTFVAERSYGTAQARGCVET